MDILVIGGTKFVGRHIAQAAMARGHRVTLLHRGVTNETVLPDATHLHADRNDDLSVLADGSWDATIDVCAYVPRQVRELADALDGRGGHHVFISTVSVYAEPDGPGLDEDARLQEIDDPHTEAVTGETYGALKVLCEREVVSRYTDPVIVRPTYVVGPHDHTWRFPWWVTRIARGGEVLAPGPPDGPMQYIDARDQAGWIVDLAERRASGTFHACAPPPPFGFRDMLDAIVDEVGPPGTRLTWVTPEFLAERGIDESSLPLWDPDDRGRQVLAADPSRALNAGLTPRPLAETIRDTLEWAMSGDAHPNDSIALDAQREAELLGTWHARP